MLKLVRDNIPDIIAKEGKTVTIRKLVDDKDFKAALRAKLDEEIDEFRQSGDAEELVDILEVVFAIARIEHKLSTQLLMERCDSKAARNGKFEKRYILEEVK